MTAASAPTSTGAPRGAMGALVLSGANLVRLAAQLALLPVLARLVGPSDYGLVSLAMPFVLFCNVLADGGLSTALARRQSPSVELESTVFWLAGAIGTSLAMLACLAAWPLGAAMNQPRLPLLILGLSPILVLSGFTAAANARVIRERRFTVFAAGDLISTFASGAAALTAALHGWGAWSLAVQQLVLWTCKFAWVVSASRLPIRRHCRPSQALDLLRFGAHSLGATLGDFLARNLDNIIVGATLGALSLGYYAMAYQIIRIPDLIISGPLYLLIFSAVARATTRPDGPAPVQIATAALRLAAIVLTPLFVGLGIVAGPAVSLVMGDQWTGAVRTLTWLSAAGLGFSLCSVAAAVLMGLGRSELQFRMAMASGLCTVAGVALSVRFGLAAVGATVAVVTLCAAATYMVVLARALHAPVRSLLSALAPAAVGGVCMGTALLLSRPIWAAWPPALGLGAAILSGAAVYGAVVALLARRSFRADLQAFNRADEDQARTVD